MHPSRCFVVCILRGALLCAKEKCLPYLSGSRIELGPDEGCARERSRKASPPFLAHGSSEAFRELRVLCV